MTFRSPRLDTQHDEVVVLQVGVAQSFAIEPVGLHRVCAPIGAGEELHRVLHQRFAAVEHESAVLEGVIATRKDSRYESGERSGAWLKLNSTSSRSSRLPTGRTLEPLDPPIAVIR